MFLLREKLITHGEKWETSSKTCNETMLRAKLRVFVSHISPPLVLSRWIVNISRSEVSIGLVPPGLNHGIIACNLFQNCLPLFTKVHIIMLIVHKTHRISLHFPVFQTLWSLIHVILARSSDQK